MGPRARTVLGEWFRGPARVARGPKIPILQIPGICKGEFFARKGYSRMLLTRQNAKTTKGESKGYGTAILYLAPVDIAVPNRSVCPFASKGCAAACLYTAGRGQMNTVQNARIRKTRAFWSDRTGFIARLQGDVARHVRWCDGKDLLPAVRLNGTSDLEWHRWLDFEAFPAVRWYDYTKSFPRMVSYLQAFNARKAGPPFRAHGNALGGGRPWPTNYHLTFSRSEENHAECLTVLRHGGNVAAVFADRPKDHLGFPVHSGDDTDLRFLDKGPAWIALKPKGDAKRDRSGFVVRTAT